MHADQDPTFDPEYAPQYDIDWPGHLLPVSIIVRGRRADDLSPDHPVTMLQIHGTFDQLVAVAGALVDAGWPPFAGSDLAPCQPLYGCHHGIALVDGYMNSVDIKAALVLLGDADHLPYEMPLPHERG